MTQLNVSDDDLKGSRGPRAHDQVTLLAGRFDKDQICPAERLDRLQAAFGDRQPRVAG